MTNNFYKKGISPLIATVLLIVVAVALILIILNWGKSFTHESVKVIDYASFTESDLEGYVFVKKIFESTDGTDSRLILDNRDKLEDANIIAYKILDLDPSKSDIIDIYYEYDTPVLLQHGHSKDLNVICFPSNEFDIEFYTSDEKCFKVNVFDSSLSCQSCLNLPYCGDSSCNGDETANTCYSDCGSCGDGICTSGEENMTSCYTDCGSCGDGICTSGEENATTCYDDCGECGNSILEGPETCDSDTESCTTSVLGITYVGTHTCLGDCSAYETCTTTKSCGDGVCQNTGGDGETVSNCYDDCGVCGNSVLEGPETCDSDTSSCTTSVSGITYVGTHICLGDCSAYGTCTTTKSCGDGICQNTGGDGETTTNCSSDCIDFNYASGTLSLSNTIVIDNGDIGKNLLVKIDNTHFILVYNEFDGMYETSYIKTFFVDSSNNFTELDSYYINLLNFSNSSLIMIDDTHFIYSNKLDSGPNFIKTFSLDSSYNITEIDNFNYDYGGYLSLVKIDDTHFMLAHDGYGNDGFLETFSLDSSYNITKIDSLEHDTLNGSFNSLVKIDDTHFMLAYAGDGSDGYLKTFSIDSSYNITEIDSLEHDTLYGTFNSLVKIDDTHFMLAYAGDGSDGYLKTFSIDSSYNITEIDSLEHDTLYGTYNSLIHIYGDYFMLAYTGDGFDGYLKTFSLDSSYNITEINSLEHDTVYGMVNSLISMDYFNYLLFYNNSSMGGNTSKLKLFEYS